MEKQPCVYILASQHKGTLYIGVTSNLVKRCWEHKTTLVDGFTKKYAVHCLVYYELHDDMASAITREKQLKKWNRVWKCRLIEKSNPEWRDLWKEILGVLDSRREISGMMRGLVSGMTQYSSVIPK
jgi:putative endonuclease